MKNYNNYGVVDVRDSSTTVGMTFGVVDDWIPVSTGMTTGEVVVGGRDSSAGVGMTVGVVVVGVTIGELVETTGDSITTPATCLPAGRLPPAPYLEEGDVTGAGGDCMSVTGAAWVLVLSNNSWSCCSFIQVWPTQS